MTTPNEEVDDLYARLEALAAENTSLRGDNAHLMVEQTQTLVRALGAERDLRTLRAVLTPSEENAAWLQNLLLLRAGVLVANMRAADLLRALCERAGIKP